MSHQTKNETLCFEALKDAQGVGRIVCIIMVDDRGRKCHARFSGDMSPEDLLSCVQAVAKNLMNQYKIIPK